MKNKVALIVWGVVILLFVSMFVLAGKKDEVSLVKSTVAEYQSIKSEFGLIMNDVVNKNTQDVQTRGRMISRAIEKHNEKINEAIEKDNQNTEDYKKMLEANGYLQKELDSILSSPIEVKASTYYDKADTIYAELVKKDKKLISASGNLWTGVKIYLKNGDYVGEIVCFTERDRNNKTVTIKHKDGKEEKKLRNNLTEWGYIYTDDPALEKMQYELCY